VPWHQIPTINFGFQALIVALRGAEPGAGA
jgi:hypothetical protein